MVDTWGEDVDIEQGFTGPIWHEGTHGVDMPTGAVGSNLGSLFPDTSSWQQAADMKQAADMMSAAGIGSLGDVTPPAWWDAQVGGHKYGSFHKFGPEDYADTFNLQPGNRYSYNDLITNQMLGDMDQIDWSYDRATPYQRSSPLIRSHWSGIGEDIPDSLLFDPIYDDERRLEGYSWNPYKDENIPFMEEEVTEDAISPYLGPWQDLFEFRDFPWMNEGNPVLTETFNNDLAAGDTYDQMRYELELIDIDTTGMGNDEIKQIYDINIGGGTGAEDQFGIV